MASPRDAAADVPALGPGAEVPGTVYRLVERIDTGRDPLGDQVWVVRHADIQIEFVMKLLPLGHPGRQALIERLQGVEARAQSGFSHKNLVRVFDIGVTAEGQPFFVLEKLSGQTLRAELRATGHVALPRALELGKQLLEGLAAAHGAGALHGDLRPEKVFVTQTGIVKILGFGKILDVGTEAVIAPPPLPGRAPSPYAAPEASPRAGADGAPPALLDGRADVFAVGVILYEMITGKLPYATSPSGASAKASPPSVTSPQLVPADLDAVLLRAIAPDPGARFADAAAFGAELGRIAARVVAEGKPASLRGNEAEEASTKWAGPPSRKRGSLPDGSATAAFSLVPSEKSGGENVYTIAPGTLLAGKYRVVRVIGKGGMGLVVEAKHLQLDTRVAMKFLLPEFMSYTEASGRFLREARAASKIQSHHVARVLDVGTLDGGEPYMVMEYLAGEDLAYHAHASTPMSIGEAIECLTQACDAIAEAHKLGIVHRDLKPANLFLTRKTDGSPMVKVLDFGISKVVGEQSSDVALTQTTTILGSALYMSPEQMQSAKNVDQRTDIYALGVCLFEMITRKQPYFAESFPELCAKVYTEPPKSLRSLRPEAPEGLERVLEKAIARDPEKRYQSVAELVQALSPYARLDTRARMDSLLRQYGPLLKLLPPAAMTTTVSATGSRRPAATASQPPPSRPAKEKRRSRAPLVLLLAALGIGGALVALTFRQRAPNLTAQSAEAETAIAAPSTTPAASADPGAAAASADPSAAASAGVDTGDAGALAADAGAAADAGITDAGAADARAGDAGAGDAGGRADGGKPGPGAVAVGDGPKPAGPGKPPSPGAGDPGTGSVGPAVLPDGPKTPPPPVNGDLSQEVCTATMPDGTKKQVPCN